MKQPAAGARSRATRVPERVETNAQRDSAQSDMSSSSPHFCSRLSLIAPWPADKCEACDGRATAQQLDALKARARGFHGGGFELTRSRRLAHALVLFK